MFAFLISKFTFFFGAAGACAPHSFFFIPPWYEYLHLSQDGLGRCSPVVKFPDDILAIGLAIVHMLLSVAGFLAVISIIIAGVEYISTQGNSEKGVSARKRVVNSIIGLAIVIAAIGIVSFTGNTLK